jgi:hypothetical protein
MLDIVELRNELGVTPAEDARVSRLASRVVGLWEQNTNRLWNRREHYEKIWQPECSIMYLWTDLYPIDQTEFTMIEWWAQDGISGAVSVNKDTDLFIRDDVGEIMRVRTARFRSFVKLTYTGGYDKTTVPFHVKETLMLQAKFMNARYTKEKVDQESVSVKGGSTTFINDPLHPEFQSLAKSMRRF